MIGSKRFRKILRYGTLSSALLAAGLMVSGSRATEFDIGAGNEQSLTAQVTDGIMNVNSGTLKVTISALGAVNTVTVKDAASMVFQNTTGVKTTVNSTMTVESGGLANFISSGYTTIGHDGSHCLMAGGSNATLTLAGTGIYRFSGGGTTAFLSGDGVNMAMRLSAGGWLDVVSGSNLVFGGWSSRINWTGDGGNQGSLNAAGRVSLWDGNEITIDALTGAGIVEAGAVKLGIAGTTNSDAFGVTNNTAIFSGVLRDQSVNSANKVTRLTKVGTGTQVLSGNNTYTGTTTVSEGILQIGNGGTSGTLGTGAVTVASGATLAFNRSGVYTINNSVTNQGTISLVSGDFDFTNLNVTETGNVEVLGTASLALSSKAITDKVSFESTALACLYANDVADSNAWTSAEIASYRTGATSFGTTNVGVYVKSGTTFTGNGVLVGTDSLQKFGMGVMKITADTSSFTQGLGIKSGSVVLSGEGKLAGTCVVATSSDSSLVYDYGAGSDTVLTSNVTGSGSLVINSGTVQVTTASPTYGGITYTAVANTIAKDGATLVFQDTTGPRPSGTSTLTAEAGGTIRFLSTNTSVGHANTQSLAITGSTGKLTFAGAGTFEFSGGGVTALHTGSAAPVASTVALSDGGWFDVKDASTLVIGGYSMNIAWTSNKGSLNVGSGCAANLWDGNQIVIDSLTGAGNITRGAIKLGIANNVDNEKYGVTNHTANYSGVLSDGTKTSSITKVGTGTQILSGDNTYTGTTTVSAGTLQVGAGGTTGSVGTGKITVATGATLAFNKSTETTLNVSQINSCVGTISAMKSTLNIGSAEAPITASNAVKSLNADSGATLNYFVGNDASQLLDGRYTGAGTIHFVGNNATLDASEGAFNMGVGGKVVLDGGTLSARTLSNFGTLSVTGNATWNLVNPPETWRQTMYSAADGNITPESSSSSMVSEGTRLDMSNVANNSSNTSVRAAGLVNNSAWSYLTNIYIPEAITVDVAGSYDDYAGLFVKKLADVDGVAVDSGWQTVLGFGAKCSKVTTDGFALEAGYYLLDARVGDATGDAFANSGDIKDSGGNRLGLGIRETGTLSSGVYAPLTIDPETGTVGFAKILTSGSHQIIQNNFEMAAGTTLTLNNTMELDSLRIQTQAVGEGTLALTNSATKNLAVDLSGSSVGNLKVGENITLALSKDKKFDVTGSYEETGAVNYAVDLTGITEDTVWFGDVDSASLNSDSKYVFTTSDSQMPLVTLTFFNEEAVSSADWAKMLDFSQVADVLNIVSFTDADGLHLMVGDHSALPEPATWGMLLVGMLLGVCRFATRERKTARV